MKRNVKRFLIVILVLIMVVLFSGCGSYVYGPNRPSGNGNGSGGGTYGPGGNQGENPGGNGGNQGGNNGGGNQGDTQTNTFTVTLVKEGKIYTNTNGIKAQWVNRYSAFSADFVDGVATISGLDGEYHVTLSQMPHEPGREYTYDCNGYIANNGNKDIQIELLEILNASRGQQSWYEITKLGTYRVSVSRNQEVLYYFFPEEAGWYSITSWVDTTANQINPKVNIYNGNAFSGFKVLAQTVNDGGSSSTVTKNFRFEVKINADEVGNNQIFGVTVDTAEEWPATVDFTVKYEGEYIRQDFGEPVYANGPFLNTKPSGTFSYAYKDNFSGIDQYGNYTYTLDGSKVRMKETGEGAGFYHLYDVNRYADNGGWGPMLFAMIGHDTEVIWTIDDGGVHVDGGFTWNITLGEGKLSLISDGFDYAYMISNSRDDNGVNHVGYVNYLNSDGAHPVNEELKQLLQAFAVSQWLFNDGDGWAEDSRQNTILNDYGSPLKPGVGLRSSENDQWLFACGYYK